MKPIWVEMPDGELYNLAYAMAIKLHQSDDRWLLFIKFNLMGKESVTEEDDYEIIDRPWAEVMYSYSDQSRAEEDLAKIRMALNPVVRLKSIMEGKPC